MKNKKEKKKTNFNYSEEVITSTPNPTEQELKNVCLGAVILDKARYNFFELGFMIKNKEMLFL